MPRRVSSPNLFGRAVEASQLRAAYERGAEAATTVIVAGEAGVGKTRLVEDLIATVRASGGPVIAGGCIDLGDHGTPFAPFIDGLRSLVREHPSEVEAALDAAGSELWRLMPGHSGAGAESADDGVGQARLFEQFLMLLDRLGRSSPVLVVLEDLHWADRSTRDLIQFLVHAMRGERVCLVLTYRSDDLHRRHPLLAVLAELTRSSRVETVALGRLGLDDTVALVRSIGDGGGDGAVVFDRSDGNPFLVEELVAAGLEDPGPRIPVSIRETLMVRITRLPAPTQELLRIASVVGRRVDHALLEDLSGLPTGTVIERIQPAVDAHIVLAEAEPAAYRFRHALVGETLYDELLPASRTGLHLRAAEALEGRIETGVGPLPSQAEVAHHWARAHATDRALVASMRAAEEAATLFAYADIRAQLERVLTLWPTVAHADELAGSDQAAIMLRAADAAAMTDDYGRAVALGSDVVLALDADADPDRWLAAIRRLAWYHWDSGDAIGAEETMARGQDAFERASAGARVGYLVDMSMVHWSAGRFPEQARVTEAALLIPGTEPGIALATALAMHGVAILSMGQVTAGVAEVEAATATPERFSDDPGHMPSVWLTHALAVGGWHERTVEAGYARLERMREEGLIRRFGPYLVANLADPLYELGRWDESQALMDDIERQGADSRAMPWIHESMAEIAARRGDTARAAAVLAAARARVSVRDAVPDRMWLERTTGAVAAAAGRLHEARAAFRASIELSPDPIRDRPLAVWAITEALTVESDIAEIERSRSLAPAGATDPSWSTRLFAIAEAIAADSEGETAPSIVLFVAHARAERTRFDGRWDVSAWADVVAAADAARQPWDAAWARTREAEARLVVDRDRATATVLLHAARVVADELGDRQLQTRIDRLATSARLDVTTAADEDAVVDDAVSAPAAWSRLSPREREVLALVSQGRTNREIADALFISEKTASVHVSHILDKLGVSSRVEAALMAARGELYDPSTAATGSGSPP